MTTDGSAPVTDSMQLIAALFALIPIPVAVANEKGSIVLSNSSFAEVFQGQSRIPDMAQREMNSPGHGTFELHSLPLNDLGFKIVYANNVSVQRLLGKQVEQLEKMAAIGRAITGIAHELNNPLADILDYVPIVEQCNMDSTARSIVDVVFTNAERAGHLVQNVLVLAGTTESQHVPFDLNEIVRNATVQRRALYPGSNLEITLDLETNLPRTLGYPSQIEQVITSLLVHAEDAIAGADNDYGCIRVQTGLRAGRVQVQIADNGLTRDTMRIFIPGSTGVGLNICAEIAKDHGGDLFAWSANGSGSTFTLELPSFGQESVRSSTSANLGRLLQNKSVMVVDDEIQISELIYDVLMRHGAMVQVSSSGVGACELLYENDYDLIICDQLMPGLGGESLYRLMKSEKPSRSQLFLFMTGDVITVQARQFYAQAGVHYLRKPFRIQDLVEAVEAVFSRNQPRGF